MPTFLPSHVRLLDASRSSHDSPIDKLAYELVSTLQLRRGDLVLCVAGDVLPTDGVAVEADGLAIDGTDGADSSIRMSGGTALRAGARITAGYLVARLSGPPR